MAVHDICHIGQLQIYQQLDLIDLRLIDSVFKYAYIGYTSTYIYCAHTLI